MKLMPEQMKEYLETEIKKAVEPFLLEPVDVKTKCAIKSAVMSVFHAAHANGLIEPDRKDKFPIVDVNDTAELEYLEKEFKKLSEQHAPSENHFVYDGRDEVDRQLWKVSQRMVCIQRKNRRRDPIKIDIAMKHPETFEPWNFK